MKNYIENSISIRQSAIQNQNYIFAPVRYRSIRRCTKNVDFLENLIQISKQNINIQNNIGHYDYIEIGDININTGGIIPENRRSIDISSASVYKIKKGDILVSTVRTYLGGIGMINESELKNLVCSKALIVLRELKKDINRHYLFGIMRSSFFINQATLLLNAGVYPRMERDHFKHLVIPFPTSKNHPNPEKIQEYVSVLVQNMIDKEEQIGVKNEKIDALIENELLENQKNTKHTYEYPRISEIRREGRLDTGIFSEKFKSKESLLSRYESGFSDIFSLKYEIFRGQNLQVSNIGESWYFDDYKKGSYRLLLSKYFGNRTVDKFSYIGNKNELKTIQKGDIIFSCRGEMGRAYYFPEEIANTITNIDNVHITSNTASIEEKTYLFCMLGFLKKAQILDAIACTGSGAPSFTKYQFEKLKIPNFPIEKQSEIAREYYNPTEKNENLTLENYLELEKIRNAQVGIFQLNMELFVLRERLEEVIDAIVMERQIEIKL